MNVAGQTHPTREELAEFLAGKLNAVDSDNIEQHLNECPACRDILNSLPSDDTIVNMLCQQEADTSASNDIEPAIPETIVPEDGLDTRTPRGKRTQFADSDQAELQLPPEYRD